MNKLNAPEERPAFERGLAIARRNWLLLAICLVVVPVVSYAYSKSQTPQYTASASLLFANQELESQILGLTPSANSDPQRVAATNLKLASLEQVASRTAEALPDANLSATEVSEKISVSPDGESELIDVAATDASPPFAARLANEFARQFINFSRESERGKIVRAQELAESKLDSLPSFEREGLAGETLSQRVRELETLAAIQTGKAELAQPATIPSAPSSPKTSRNVALGILLGVLLGIGLVLLREQFDRRIRDADELEDLFELPVLGTIPQSSAIADPEKKSAGAGDEIVGEAFRMLRANLRYFNIEREVGSILVTSGAPQDGKTMIAWNVSLAEAGAGRRVLCIEADLRRPTLAEYLNITPTEGLGLVLAGAIEPWDAIRTVHGVDLLPAGPLPPNPGELLESRQMTELLAWAEATYDRVIIDTPPAAVVADALPLFNQVGGVVVVARLRKSTREASEHLRDQLKNMHAPLLGLVVNGASKPPETSYYRSQAISMRFDQPADMGSLKGTGSEKSSAKKTRSASAGSRESSS